MKIIIHLSRKAVKLAQKHELTHIKCYRKEYTLLKKLHKEHNQENSSFVFIIRLRHC